MNLALTRGWTLLRDRTNTARAPARWFTGERVGKVVIVTLFSLMATRLARDTAATGHATGLLLVVNEALVVMLTLIRRRAEAVDRSSAARVLTVFSTFSTLLVRPASRAAVVPDAVTLIISGIGLGCSMMGKLSLGRSFGLAPANRGVVSTGLYRLVRHPIYLGYLITHVGFLIANPLAWNLEILGAADTALMLRALREERTLAQDQSYREYLTRVRWHVIPGLF